MCSSSIFFKITRNRVVHTFLKLIFSNIGLCILVALYCIVGAVIFVHLEGRSEREKRSQIYDAALSARDRRENLQRQIVEYMDECQRQQQANDGMCDESRAIAKMIELIDEYERFVLHRKNESQGVYRGQLVATNQTNAPLNDWSLPSAILFTASILGTIGYGNVTPKTDTGQMAVILYAVIAIPLMSMFLFNVGNWLGDGLRFVYRKVTCNKFAQKRRAVTSGRVGPAEKGLPALEPPPAGGEQTKKADGGDPDESMPVFLVMLVGALYITTGMLIFYATEDWSLIESLYFTFISLSTIGFGDYVPSANARSTLQQMRLVMTTAYLFVGLAIFAMCISLLIGAMKDYKQKIRVIMSIVATRVKT